MIFRIKSTIACRMLCQYALKTLLHFIISRSFFKMWIINSELTISYAVSVKVTVVSDKHAATSLSVTTLIIDYVKFIIFSISEFNWAKSFIICYICKILKHLFKNCFQNKVNTFASCAFTSCLHEIIISKNKENEKMSFKNNKAKN